MRAPSGFPHLNPQLTKTLVDQAIHEKQPHNVFAKELISPIKRALMSGKEVRTMSVLK